MERRFPSVSRVRGLSAGMTLIEIMVSMFLLTIIMLGLFAAFYHTQRAFRLSTSQTDVLEGGRSTLGLIARELQEMTASGQWEGVNLYVTTPSGGIDLPLPGDAVQHNLLQDFFFLTRRNDAWRGLGYFVTVKGEGVGSLFRYTGTNNLRDPNFRLVSLYDTYLNAQPNSTNVGRVAEGIVHLTVRAFDTNGLEYARVTNSTGGEYVPAFGTNIMVPDIAVWETGYAFTNQMLPAFLDVELGIVDAQLYRQYKILSSNSPAVAVDFLRNQAGKVYMFRQRIPIRNHHEP